MGTAVGGYALARLVAGLVLLGYGQVDGRSALARLGSAWDAGWYVRIVRTGYAVSNGLIGKDGIPYSPRAFFPLYPGLARPLHQLLPISAGTALVLVSTLAGLAAAGGIHACAAHVHGRRAGVVAAVLWGVLPLAAVENMAYSESLFTAFAAWTLYAVLTRRWLSAGLLCVLAGLTRPTAMALTAAVLVAAAVELRRNGPAWRPVAAGLLAPLGWVGYMLWTGWAEHSWGAYFRIQHAWGSSFDGGLSAVRRLLRAIGLLGGGTKSPGSAPAPVFADPAQHVPAAVNLLTTVVMVLTLLACLALFRLALVQRQPPALLVYSAALLVMDLGNSSSSPPLARFLLPAFPLLFPLAARLAGLRSRRLTAALLGGGALLSAGYGIVVVFVGGAPA